MEKILEKLINTDDSNLADDDHPGRKDLTDKEADQAMKELRAKYKNQEKNQDNKPNLIADETIKALNKLNLKE